MEPDPIGVPELLGYLQNGTVRHAEEVKIRFRRHLFRDGGSRYTQCGCQLLR